MSKHKSRICYMAVILMLIASVVSVCCMGAADISFVEAIDILRAKIFIDSSVDYDKGHMYIIWDLRMPRAIVAIFAGGGLAVAGAVMQAITRNVMADPYVLGISSGSLAFVSAGACIIGKSITPGIITSVLAFTGAMAAIILVFMIGGMKNNVSPQRLVLSGMSVSIMLNAIAQYFIYISAAGSKAGSIVTWMMGSLAGVRWNNLYIPVLGIALGIIFFIRYARAFDLMALGDETAISLGINVDILKKTSMVVVAIITGLTVASCGIIGLVGFMIPHIVRFFTGSTHKKLFPLSFMIGAIFLLWMDMFARTLLEPSEVPIGIFTALCAGPLFAYMVKKRAGGNV